MPKQLFKAIGSFMSGLSEEEWRRRRRESIFIIVLLLAIVILTFVESRLIQFGTDIPVSNTVLMFILININLLLIILLIFLVFRNLVKLLYDRKQNVMGAKLRTRLVVAFISLTLVPTIVLFLFSVTFITTSIKFWFNVPVGQALEHSLQVGKSIYTHIEEKNLFFLQRAAYQINRQDLLDESRRNDLTRYIQIVQREFALNAVEVYSSTAERLAYAVSPELEEQPLAVISSSDLQKTPAADRSGVTITRQTEAGELVSSIASVPHNTPRSGVDAYLVISILLPPDLSTDLAFIARGYTEYRQIKMLQDPIQGTYLISLTLVALLVLFCAVWIGFYIARSITTPIMELAKGLGKVAAGDLNYTIEQQADDEIGMLVQSFNKMTDDLRIGREELEKSAGILKTQKDELEERRLYMETVLDNISTGVISLNAEGVITTLNKSAEKMLALSQHDVLNKHYTNILGGHYLQLAEECIATIKDSGEDTLALPLKLTINGRPRSFMMYLTALRNEVLNRYMGVVLVVDDLTELERAQRMAAWREVARRIAHEVKNPLTPISLSAQRLQKKFADRVNDPVFDECLRTILDYVDLIRNLVNEFSAFAKFPMAKPEPCDLLPIIRETTALYAEDDNRIDFIFHAPDTLPRLNLDRRQIKQALNNLIDNAIAAMEGFGVITITVTCRMPEGKVVLEFADTGKGIADSEKGNMFEPYFSTKKTGMGLGLAIINSIITDHGGKITVHDNKPRGAKFIIEFPI